jgi:hypothetical protein
VRYELGFYIPEDGILHSHRRENLKSYIKLFNLGRYSSSYFCLQQRFGDGTLPLSSGKYIEDLSNFFLQQELVFVTRSGGT